MGGMLGYLVVNPWGVNVWLGCVLVVLVAAASPDTSRTWSIWKPLRRRGLGLAQMMIVTIGLALALQYVYQYFIAADTVKIVISNPTPHSLGPIIYNSLDLLSMAALNRPSSRPSGMPCSAPGSAGPPGPSPTTRRSPSASGIDVDNG